MDDLAKFGVRIKTLRKLNRYTQEVLSEKIDRAVSAISSIERGQTRPSWETLVRMSAALEVPLCDLFDFEGCRDKSYRDDSMRLAYMTVLTTLARDLGTQELGWVAEVVKTMAMARLEIKGERVEG